MIGAGLIVAAIAQASSPAPFAPPLEHPIMVRVSETRDVDGAVTVAVLERRVTFSAAPTAIIAEVETLPQPPKAAGGGDRIATIALSALAGQRLSITIDRTGRATDVADHDRLWNLVVAGIERDLAAQKLDAARRATAESMVTPLRTMPPERKVAMLASCIEPMMGTQILAAGVREPHDVSMTLRSPDGVSMALTGTERSFNDEAGLLVLERQLSGSNGDRRVSLNEVRRVDVKTGLFRDTRMQVDWWAAGGHLKQIRSTEITPAR